MNQATRIRVALALGAFALAWPVLDILGRNAEFFIARGSTRSEVIAVSSATWRSPYRSSPALPATLPGRFGRLVGEVWVWSARRCPRLSDRPTPHGPWPEVLALLLGGALLFGSYAFEGIRSIFAILAWSPIAMAAYFLWATPSGVLVLDPGPQ